MEKSPDPQQPFEPKESELFVGLIRSYPRFDDGRLYWARGTTCATEEADEVAGHVGTA